MLSIQWQRYRKAEMACVARPGSIADATAAALKPCATVVGNGQMGTHLSFRARRLAAPPT
jgi:hypothetical protein